MALGAKQMPPLDVTLLNCCLTSLSAFALLLAAEHKYPKP